jgi:hypothetical protein
MDQIGKIIFLGEVVDSDDPDRLGRIRFIPESIPELDNMKKSLATECTDGTDIITNVKKKCKWTKDDPFLVSPLLPFSLNITPKAGELIYIIYPVVQNAQSQSRIYADQTKYYIPTSPSSTMSVAYENKTTTKTSLAQGTNFKPQISLKQIGGRIPEKTFGIFPEPEDNAVLGRGTADLILKDDTALLRAGKSNDIVGPKPKLPTENEKRSFVQLTNFKTKQRNQSKSSFPKISFNYNQLKLLIEWHISNPENLQNVYSGYINIYNVQKQTDQKLNTKNFKVDTDVESLKGTQLPISINFIGLSFEETLNIFNSFIRGLNDGRINIPGYTSTPFVPEAGKQFPFAFRPSPATYKKLVNSSGGQMSFDNIAEKNNIMKFFTSIGLATGGKTKGFGIVHQKNLTVTPISFKKQQVNIKSSENQSGSYGIMGAEKIYLYSHDSQIGVKKPSLKNTIYGLDQNKFLELEESTNSMVRGEKLMDLLSLMVKYMVAHVHPYHGVPPVPTAMDGTLASDILQKMADAANTILNENIRIN